MASRAEGYGEVVTDQTERDRAEDETAEDETAEQPGTGKHGDKGHVMVTQAGPMPAGPEMEDAWAPSPPPAGD